MIHSKVNKARIQDTSGSLPFRCWAESPSSSQQTETPNPKLEHLTYSQSKYRADKYTLSRKHSFQQPVEHLRSVGKKPVHN